MRRVLFEHRTAMGQTVCVVQNDLTAEEAELKLLNLKHALEKERREKASQEAGFTPQLLNPEDTGELF